MKTTGPTNFLRALEQIKDYWSPRVVGRVNDQYVKVAKLKGQLARHTHEQEDEMFVVVYGRLRIQFEDYEVELNPGEFYVVPRNTMHNPVAEEECGIVLIETVTTQHTGTVKTSLLNSMARFIPEDERLLLIEDTAEIQINHSNLVRFEARPAQNGVPAVGIRDLLKAALRHRPDRILLGEIRGGEAFDLLQLLNTGHAGTISTIHANSARQGLSRFTSCVLQSGVELPYRAIKSNIADSLNVVVQIERRPGRRVISEVIEIKSYDPDADVFDYCSMCQKAEALP